MNKAINLAGGIFLFLFGLAACRQSGHIDGLIPPAGTDPIHALGNGRMCVFGRGTDLTAGYAGLYSSPSFFRMKLIRDENLKSVSIRKPGTAIWTHTISSSGRETGRLVDFVDSEIPCFVRKIVTENRMTIRLNVEKYVQVIDNTNRLPGNRGLNGRLLIVPPGTKIYQTYVYPRILYGQILTSGKASIQASPGTDSLDIICEPGESYLFLIGGPEYPELMSGTNLVLELKPGYLLSRTEQYWNEFTGRRKDFARILPDATPMRTALLQRIDDVAVLLKTQQSSQGAELAGYPYPLGYVRDQYGVSRGFLALGLTGEAKAIVNYYWQIWKKYGYIHNAQAIGIDGVFHIHENDEVECTGYLILQAFDLLNATHDQDFMATIAPMLEWAFISQKKNLVRDMLPFNGDETYVPGGMLPRSALNDGSAEATMLFIESGRNFLDWVAANNYWPEKTIAENRTLVSRCKANFMDNFWHDGILWANNPVRARLADLPRYRHGVCEAGGPGCLMTKYRGIVWTERNENGRYVCAVCLTNGKPLPAAEPRQYNIPSVSLAPFFINCTIMPFEKLEPAVIQMFIKKDEPRTVGYDYGFLLSALTRLNRPEAFSQYEKTLSVADETGAWAEYYLNDRPYGTRCRPWESAVNLESLINFALTQNLR